MSLRHVGLILAFSLIILAGCGKDRSTSALNINDLGADPGAYSGTLTVVGVTAAFTQQDRTLFGVMDKKELQCKTPNCNKMILPVRFRGPLPALGDEVLLSGSLTKETAGYFFVAEQVEVLRNHKLGGTQ